MVLAKILAMCAATACAATALTTGGLLLAPNASARQRPIVVTAPTDIVVRHVSYADLNLASERGAKVLNRRVDGAIDSLCIEAVGPDTYSLATTTANMACTAGAWKGARPQIARAVERARQIAATGSSTIAASAIVITLPK